ncbi:MAG: hypothetical protein KR126chlam4_00016 [Candidatus Anoxychlamydiales bacterium]|uniref:Uncharacterized protein n=1 Tax=marine sediment metagenome TaxID=412755 RepID=A0A0F9GB75_9ZZZZ|nr:hypothetical protein [Candidatus Anoxychlamydiales bacterium]NGX40199.1 hypothetical protein [Candidatus Anoxychlamydiales bacterium]HEU64245.1 hypothetical protein [Chlamydiota bacterium]
MNKVIAFLGESEMGRFYYPYFCSSLTQLATTLGNPPEDSRGLDFAIQAIMYERDVIYFRVEEEGFSIKDYIKSFEIIKDKKKVKRLDAICIPGVGDIEIILQLDPICKLHSSIIITTQKDLFDYLLAE